jgi:small subunit ribosomal protein S2
MSEKILNALLEGGTLVKRKMSYWNPKMAKYFFGARNKIHIIDLEHALPLFNEAMHYLGQMTANKGTILFVGTKKATRKAVAAEAKRCGMPYVNHRWLGGMLTNFKTIKKSINRLKELEAMKADGTLYQRFSKKEALGMERELEKLERSLGGIKEMRDTPDVIFVLDVGYEKSAVMEAKKLGIPVVGVMDPNSSPDTIDYVIPGNDDSIRAVTLYCQSASATILEAKAIGIDATVKSEEIVEMDFNNETTWIDGEDLNQQKLSASLEPTRHVSAGIEEDEWPLVVDRKYLFYVSIGAKREGALGGGALPEPDWGGRSELELLISLQGDGVKFFPQNKKITLHKSMENLTEHFKLVPLRPGLRSAWIMIQLARELTLLQEYHVTLEVIDAPEETV